MTHLWKLQCYHAALVGHGPACPKFSEISCHYLGKGCVIFLHVVICILLDIHWNYKNRLFWADIVKHRFSANNIVRCFKLKKLKVRCPVDFLLPLKLQKYAVLGYYPKILLANQFAVFFYFWLVWLVNHNIRGPLLLVFSVVCMAFNFFWPLKIFLYFCIYLTNILYI